MKTISLLFTICTISLFSCNIQKNVSKINDEKELEHGNNYGLNSVDAQSLPYGATMFDCIYNFYNQNKTNSINTTNWTPLGPINHPSGSLRGSGPGRVTFVYLDPYHTNRMFTGSATGGLFISNDMGQNWEQTINNNFGPVIGVSSIVTFPNQPNTWIVATGDGEGWGNENADNPSWGIYRTMDGGITYQKIENFYDPILQNSVNLFQIKKLVLDDHNNPNFRLYAATSFGLFICDNPLSASPQWTNAYTGLNYEEIFDIEFKRTATGYDYQTIFASGTRVIMSNDYGITWSQIYNFPNTKRITIETTPANLNELYLAVTTNLTRVYKYNLVTTTVSPSLGNTAVSLTVNRHQAFGISPVDEHFMFCGDVSLYYTKSTLPFVWTGLGSKLHDDMHGIAFTPDGSKVFIANDGGIHYIETSLLDGTSQPNFIPLNKGLNVANIQSFSTSPINKNLITWASEHTGGNIMFNGNSRNLIVADGRKSIFCENGTNFYTSGQENNIKFYNLDLADPLNLYTQNNITIGASNATFDTYFTIGNSDPAVFYGNYKIANKDNIVRKASYGANANEQITDFQTQFLLSNNTYMANYKLAKDNKTMYLPCWDCGTEPCYTGNYADNVQYIFYNPDATVDPNIVKTTWQKIEMPVNPSKPINDLIISKSNPNIIYVTIWNSEDQNKIFMYNKTTNVWTNLTKNLPSCTFISTILIDEGDQDILYIGMHKGGVWTLSEPSNMASEWKLFNNNFPLINISSMEIVECANKIRVGTFGLGIWESDLIQNENVYEVTSNQVWNDPKKMDNKIIVKSGYSLTLNSKLEMSNLAATIIVERGAQLIIDGPNAKITNACQARWPGIQVWGNSNVPQNSANAAQFGKVIVRNGGTIENAETAITTMKIDDQGNWDWNYSGGIVQCTDANFINNWHDVGFLNYTNYNANGQEMITQSYFTRTNFTTNEYYNYKEFGAPDWHVTIDHSSGIRFKGCTFKNLKTTPPTDYIGTEHLWAGGGIYAINSQIFVDQYCSGFTINCNNAIPTTFENLREGILVTGTLKNRKLNCLHSKFINNATNGIYVRSQNYANIIANDFIYNTDNLYNYEAATGLYQIGALISLSTGYRIEENNFTGNANGTYSQAGIKIVNSGGAPNEIYRNTFNNLYYGATALGTNKNTKINANGVGLQLLCLTHQNNRWDNAVTKKFNEPGIALYQGNLLGPNFRTADNTFSNITGTACTDVFNYYNECEFINYAGSSNLQYSPTLYDCNSIYVSNNIASNTGCPTKIGWHKKLSTAEKQSALNNLNSKSTELQNAKALLSLITDGGNTNSVINAIAQSQPAQTQQLVSSLMSLSPNVSLPVLLKVAHEDDKMSPTLQMLVLIANTQGGKNQKIIDTLRNKQNPMDPAMIDYILDNRNNTSLKEKMESQVNTLIAEKEYMSLVLINDLMEDTIGVDKDSIALLIDNMEGNEKYYAKIYAAANDNNFMLCDSIYNNLGDSIEDRYSLADYESIGEIIALEKALMASNRNYHQLDINEIESLRNLARGEYATKGMMMAQNILENAVGDEFEPYLKFPEEVQERRSKPQVEKLAMPATIENAFFKVYPNPTKSQTNLSYVLLPGQKGVASISDSNGKVVYETVLSNEQNSLSIDLSNFAPSTYFLRVLVNNEVKYNETLVIRK